MPLYVPNEFLDQMALDKANLVGTSVVQRYRLFARKVE